MRAQPPTPASQTAQRQTGYRHAPLLDPHFDGADWRARWRRYAAAWMLGVAVVIAPAWPSAAQERAARRPPYERALSWRDFIRLRLSPWLLMQQGDGPIDPRRADEFRAEER